MFLFVTAIGAHNLHVSLSAELAGNWTGKPRYSAAYSTWKKGVIQFDLDDPSHVIRSVLRLFSERQNTIAWALRHLPLGTRKWTNVTQLRIKYEVINNAQINKQISSLAWTVNK